MPQTWGMQPPVVSVGGTQLNYAISLPELMSRATISVVGLKAMHPVIN